MGGGQGETGRRWGSREHSWLGHSMCKTAEAKKLRVPLSSQTGELGRQAVENKTKQAEGNASSDSKGLDFMMKVMGMAGGCCRELPAVNHWGFSALRKNAK